MDELLYKKEIPIAGEYDVIVAGGGPAGVAAAVSAAKAAPGIRVLLFEQSGVLGGASSLAMVPEVMNFGDGVSTLSRGFGESVFRRVFVGDITDLSWRPVKVEALKRAYDELVTGAGVNLLLYTRLVDAEVDGDGAITHLILSGQEGVFAVSGAIFVDATGCAALARLAGADVTRGDESGNTMPATLCSLWGGIDFERKGRDADSVEAACRDGVFSIWDTVLPGIKRTYPGIGVGGGNVGHCFSVDDGSSRSMTDATLDGRRRMPEYETFYRNYVPGCENAELILTAPWLGIRESFRVDTVSTLTNDHFDDGYSYPDEIGRYSYPIDIHPMTADPVGMAGFYRSVSRKLAPGQSYGIPYGALLPKKVKNLLVVGRNIGADREMAASVRVIPACFITGQAAGIGAALAAKEKIAPAAVEVDQIRKTIDSIA